MSYTLTPPAPRGTNENCGRCAGTGRYITRVENGKPVGPDGASCFRCQGKGYQSDADRTRNFWYDAKYQKVRM